MLRHVLAVVLGLLALASALPALTLSSDTSIIRKRGCSCDTLAPGLNPDDCAYMSSIGMAGQGVNSQSDNGIMWIGSGGPNTFTFTNEATSPSNVPVILVVWAEASGDYEASFMNVRSPHISYSLPNIGDSVTISIANGISGGWAALNNHETMLSQYGQIYNTWGEFTTGSYATVDVTREVNMGGNLMSLKVTAGSDPGCVSDMSTCVFNCLGDAGTCGESGTYQLLNCDNGSQTGAVFGTNNGNPSGGCQGWNNGGHIEVSLRRY